VTRQSLGLDGFQFKWVIYIGKVDLGPQAMLGIDGILVFHCTCFDIG